MQHIIKISLLLIVIGLASTFAHSYAQDNSSGSWELLGTENAPTPRHENGFVQYDGRFYLIGGRGMHPVDIYDPATNRWSEGAPPPIELHHIQPFVYADEIWIVNAYTGRCCDAEFGAEHIYIYSPARDAWRLGPEIPIEHRRGAAGVVLHNNVVYVVGGLDGGHGSRNTTAFSQFDAYDIAADEWTSLPDKPRARDHFSAVVVADKLYAIGGRNTSRTIWAEVIYEIDVFDFELGEWSTLPPENDIPTPRAGAAYAVIENKILVIGGETERGAFDLVEAFDITTQTWRTFEPMQMRRHGTQVAECNGALYIAAGAANRGGGPELDTIERFVVDSTASECTPLVEPTE